MARRLCSPSSGNSVGRRSAGNTIVELMMAIVVSGVVAAMVVSTALNNRALYQSDLGRTRVNQSLKSALNIIGGEARQAGERLPSSFPAVMIVDGGGTAPDELILRRNLVNQVIVGCDQKTAGVTYGATPLSRSGATTAACTAPNQAGNYSAWSNYVAAQAAPVPIYIFNQTTRNGEFLQLLPSVGGTSGGVQYISYSPQPFRYGYSPETTSLYVMNQWRVRLVDGVLQIVINEDESSVQNVIDGVTGFQVEALMQDGSTKSALAAADTWTLLAAIRLTITGAEATSAGRQQVRTVVGEFLPRNILSS